MIGRWRLRRKMYRPEVLVRIHWAANLRYDGFKNTSSDMYLKSLV